MATIHWASELVKALEKTHTGAEKLRLIRDAMHARHTDEKHADKPGNHPARHLTAVEAIAVMEAAGVGEVTLEKARQLAETGKYDAPPTLGHPAESLPPPPAVDVDLDSSADGEQQAEVEGLADKPTAKKTKAKKTGKEPKPGDPGVHDMSASDVNTIGPKAVETEGE